MATIFFPGTKEIGSQTEEEEMKETKEHYIRWYSYAPSVQPRCSLDQSRVSQNSQGSRRLQSDKEASSIGQEKLSWSKMEKWKATAIVGCKYSAVTASKLLMILLQTVAKFFQ